MNAAKPTSKQELNHKTSGYLAVPAAFSDIASELLTNYGRLSSVSL